MANNRPYFLPTEVAEFADRFQPLLERAIRNRMRRVGVPDDMIGVKYWGVDEGAFVRYHPPQIGGNVRVGLDGRPGINVDAGVLDVDAPKVAGIEAWRIGTLKDRVDAVVAHEYTEVLAPAEGDPHRHAVANAEFTPLTITDRARQILSEYREAEET